MTVILVALVLKALVVLVVAKGVPGVKIGGFASALGVATVYAVLSWLLKDLLTYLTFPAVLLTFGAFLLVLNAFLLWITDKVVASFQIKNIPALALTTLGITFGSVAVDYIVPRLF